MIANIIIGLFLIAGGSAIIAKAFYLNHQVMFLEWAEQKLGPGGGTTMYRYIGIALILLGMFSLLGVVNIQQAAFGDSSKGISGQTGQATESATPQIQKSNNHPTLIGN